METTLCRSTETNMHTTSGRPHLNVVDAYTLERGFPCSSHKACLVRLLSTQRPIQNQWRPSASAECCDRLEPISCLLSPGSAPMTNLFAHRTQRRTMSTDHLLSRPRGLMAADYDIIFVGLPYFPGRKMYFICSDEFSFLVVLTFAVAMMERC